MSALRVPYNLPVYRKVILNIQISIMIGRICLVAVLIVAMCYAPVSLGESPAKVCKNDDEVLERYFL